MRTIYIWCDDKSSVVLIHRGLRNTHPASSLWWTESTRLPIISYSAKYAEYFLVSWWGCLFAGLCVIRSHRFCFCAWRSKYHERTYAHLIFAFISKRMVAVVVVWRSEANESLFSRLEWPKQTHIYTLNAESFTEGFVGVCLRVWVRWVRACV